MSLYFKTPAGAWRYIAERLADDMYEMPYGLCWEVDEVYDHVYCSYETMRAMKEQCMDHVYLLQDTDPSYDDVNHPFAYPPGECREERILAALFLAHFVEEEEPTDEV